MGVEIKLTDKQLPVSPVFIEFLHDRITSRRQNYEWHDQLSETLMPADPHAKIQAAQAVSDAVMQHPEGQRAILRAYELLTAMLTGQPAKLALLHERYRFVCVVGCPRHGGSYLTKELFRALGHDPMQVPNAIAHDGFPDAGPFLLAEQHNGYVAMMQQTAEYLTMMEMFFAGSNPVDGRVTVPKKITKAAYHGAFFAAVFGPAAEYMITLRHPVAACISTYEKSTGLPPSGKFAVRGNIEEWAYRDNIATGADPKRLLEQDYFDVYLRYWEHYHCALALSGLLARRNLQVVAYGRVRMMNAAQAWHARFSSAGVPGEFKVYDKRGMHPEWRRKAEPALHRVAQIWHGVGLSFPLDEVMEGW